MTLLYSEPCFLQHETGNHPECAERIRQIPARLAEAAGLVPRALAQTIAAALRFDPPDDPIALELQGRLSREGVDAVLASVCQIQSDEPLAALIHMSYLCVKG